MDEAEGKEMLKGMAADCKEKEGATDEDVDGMINKDIPTTKPAKCLNACMMDQFGVVGGAHPQKQANRGDYTYVTFIFRRWTVASSSRTVWWRWRNWQRKTTRRW